MSTLVYTNDFFSPQLTWMHRYPKEKWWLQSKKAQAFTRPQVGVHLRKQRNWDVRKALLWNIWETWKIWRTRLNFCLPALILHIVKAFVIDLNIEIHSWFEIKNPAHKTIMNFVILLRNPFTRLEALHRRCFWRNAKISHFWFVKVCYQQCTTAFVRKAILNNPRRECCDEYFMQSDNLLIRWNRTKDSLCIKTWMT